MSAVRNCFVVRFSHSFRSGSFRRIFCMEPERSHNVGRRSSDGVRRQNISRTPPQRLPAQAALKPVQLWPKLVHMWPISASPDFSETNSMQFDVGRVRPIQHLAETNRNMYETSSKPVQICPHVADARQTWSNATQFRSNADKTWSNAAQSLAKPAKRLSNAYLIESRRECRNPRTTARYPICVSLLVLQRIVSLCKARTLSPKKRWLFKNKMCIRNGLIVKLRLYGIEADCSVELGALWGLGPGKDRRADSRESPAVTCC